MDRFVYEIKGVNKLFLKFVTEKRIITQNGVYYYKELFGTKYITRTETIQQSNNVVASNQKQNKSQGKIVIGY